MDMVQASYDTFQMVVVFLTLATALYYYATEKVSVELTSASVLVFLMVFFYIFPVVDMYGNATMTVNAILAGFSNPALITVFSLMIIGEALSNTGALETISDSVSKCAKNYPALGMIVALIMVGVFSAFLNNIPMVVVFMPIIVALTRKIGVSASKWLMPLSFVTILGGMTTLVGSSTNLLVSGAMVKFNQAPFDFFSFTKIGLIMAGVGAIYVLLILPKILKAKKPLKSQLEGEDERRFFCSVTVDVRSPLSGREINGWVLKDIDVEVLTIQRGKHTFERPFNDRIILPGDEVLLSATRDKLLAVASKDVDNLTTTDIDENNIEDQVLAEIIVSPKSKYVGRTLRWARLHIRRNLVPVGLERDAGILQADIMDIHMRAGDVLLVVGNREDVHAIIDDSDFILLESSAEDVRHRHHVIHTIAVFIGTILFASTGLLPVPIATFLGAVLMIAFGCISFSGALEAVDRRVVLLITTSLALGLALEQTGGALAIADNILYMFEGQSPAIILSVFFFIVMFMTNILSNQATAVLFTPIAISLATNLNVDVNAFAFAVVFAANCCFVTPFAYQTNLIVMTSGQYSFKDFVKAGLPLAITLWLVYSVVAPIYFYF